MKKGMVISLLILVAWATAAAGQGYRRGDSYGQESLRSTTERWAQEDAMRRQRHETQAVQDRQREIQTNQRRMDSRIEDIERQQRAYPHR